MSPWTIRVVPCLRFQSDTGTAVVLRQVLAFTLISNCIETFPTTSTAGGDLGGDSHQPMVFEEADDARRMIWYLYDTVDSSPLTIILC